jgi:hypothetical protein
LQEVTPVKTIKMLVAVAALLLGTLIGPTPARAGGWAVTYLDPLPDTLQPGRGYTLGYWVLQHGTHPYDGELGDTGLKLVDDQGKATTFRGVPLPEPAHYAAAVAVPHPGRWQLVGIQGIFAEYAIGTLTVPGGLAVAPTPTPMTFGDGHEHTWGAIRPPIEVAAAPASGLPIPRAATAPADNRSWPWIAVSAGAAAATVLALLGLLLARRRRAVPPSGL